ncbi:MAG: hypothetical protein AAF394_16225 [Planctomycetota bacterium]
MLSEGILEPSDGPWASQSVMIPKSDGSVRYCVNYIPLDRITIKDSYPISGGAFAGFGWLPVQVCTRRLGWQIPIAPEDRDKAAFATHTGLFRPKAMMLG